MIQSALQPSNVCATTRMTISTKIGTPPHCTKSRLSVSSVNRGTNPYWDFGLIWICTTEFEFLDLMDFGDVAFSWNLSQIRRWMREEQTFVLDEGVDLWEYPRWFQNEIFNITTATRKSQSAADFFEERVCCTDFCEDSSAQIRKSQFLPKSIVENKCSADFWEYLPVCAH